jgi:hypothetical protein
MSSEARHSLAAEACLAAHERRKCGEGSRVKDWIVYAQHYWESARAARTIVANVSREGADGLAETGMGAAEPAMNNHSWMGAVRNNGCIPETAAAARVRVRLLDVEAVAGRVQGWQRGGAFVVLISVLRLWCRAEDPPSKINECGY